MGRDGKPGGLDIEGGYRKPGAEQGSAVQERRSSRAQHEARDLTGERDPKVLVAEGRDARLGGNEPGAMKRGRSDDTAVLTELRLTKWSSAASVASPLQRRVRRRGALCEATAQWVDGWQVLLLCG